MENLFKNGQDSPTVAKLAEIKNRVKQEGKTRVEQLFRDNEKYLIWSNESIEKDRAFLMSQSYKFEDEFSYEELERLYTWARSKNSVHVRALASKLRKLIQAKPK